MVLQAREPVVGVERVVAEQMAPQLDPVDVLEAARVELAEIRGMVGIGKENDSDKDWVHPKFSRYRNDSSPLESPEDEDVKFVMSGVAVIWCADGKLYRRDYDPEDAPEAFLDMLVGDGIPFVIVLSSATRCNGVNSGMDWLKDRAKCMLKSIYALGIPDEILDEIDVWDSPSEGDSET